MKNNKPTVRKKNKEKLVNRYSHLYGIRELPTPEHVIEHILHEALKEAIENPGFLKVRKYFREKGVSATTISRWCKKYAWVEKAYNEIVEAVGDNREIGGLEYRLNPSIVSSTMAFYDKDWKNLEEWRSHLKKQEKRDETVTEQKTVYVLTSEIPNSTLVPDKNIDIIK